MIPLRQSVLPVAGAWTIRLRRLHLRRLHLRRLKLPRMKIPERSQSLQRKKIPQQHMMCAR